MALYDEVGGDGSLAPAVDDFYARMLGDPQMSSWFEGVDLRALKAHQRAFLAVGLGGPELYDGRGMRDAHAGLGITSEIYTSALAHLGDALGELGVTQPRLGRILARIELMRAAIVEVR